MVVQFSTHDVSLGSYTHSSRLVNTVYIHMKGHSQVNSQFIYTYAGVVLFIFDSHQEGLSYLNMEDQQKCL